MRRSSQLLDSFALAITVGFIGAGIWWRVSGEPATGVVIILAAVAACVLGAALLSRRGRRD